MLYYMDVITCHTGFILCVFFSDKKVTDFLQKKKFQNSFAISPVPVPTLLRTSFSCEK